MRPSRLCCGFTDRSGTTDVLRIHRSIAHLHTLSVKREPQTALFFLSSIRGYIPGKNEYPIATPNLPAFTLLNCELL